MPKSAWSLCASSRKSISNSHARQLTCLAPASFATVKQRRDGRIQRLRFVETQDNLSMFVVSSFELFFLPPLTFIATEIVYVEGTIRLTLLMKLTLQFNQALP